VKACQQAKLFQLKDAQLRTIFYRVFLVPVVSAHLLFALFIAEIIKDSAHILTTL
jgi:hypothetical protein